MREKKKKKIPELLVPAGGYEQLKAAVANGADAVYLSGSSFNARINADNFTDETLEEAVRFAHRHGVRVHVALNTLIRESEMREAVLFAEKCRDIGADALILQDRGLGAELMERIPDMTFHLSTQGTVYDRRGAEEAFRSGFRRVILARELSLKEIEVICRNSPVETEIFVHGAICIAYSGQCRLSYVIGGRSGNRGTCAQPCRLPYELNRNGESLTAADGNFLLSPADMCLADSLPRLIDAGVDSLKIEGRMKSPQYVAEVTSVYRKYLDSAAEGKPQRVADADRRRLMAVFNRGGMTDAYLRGESGSFLMSRKIPKHQGLYIGKVRSYDAARGHISAVLTEALSVGDGIEIRNGDDSCGNVVTYLNDRGNMLKTAPAGKRVTIGDLHGKIRPGAGIYRITDRALMREAEESYRNIPGRIPVDMILTAEEGRPARLELSSPLYRLEQRDFPERSAVYLQSEEVLERAEKRIPDEKTIKKQLMKTGGTPYFLNSCRVEIGGTPMIPASMLNALRRQGLELLTEERLEKMKRRSEMAHRETGKIEETDGNGDMKKKPHIIKERVFDGEVPEKRAVPRMSLYFYETEENADRLPSVLKRIQLLTERSGNIKFDICMPYRTLLSDPRRIFEITDDDPSLCVIPYLPAITKGFDERRLQSDALKLAGFFEQGHIEGISAANRGQIILFERTGVPLAAGENLHLYNSASVLELLRLGIHRGVISDELPDEEVKEILSGEEPDNGEFFPEITVFGHIPVMYTEHCVIGSSRAEHSCTKTDKKFYCREGEYSLKDRKGASFPLITDCSVCRMEILSHKPVDRFRLFGEICAASKERGASFPVIPRLNIFSESLPDIASMTAGTIDLLLR